MDSYSPESTVNTDMTVTASGESEIQKTVNINVIDEKKFIRDIQLLRLQLAQKDLVIEGVRADYLSRTDELEEKLADAIYQKQILQLRLEAQLKFVETASKEREITLKDEIQKLKLKTTETNNTVVSKLIRNLKENFAEVIDYSEHYEQLKNKNQDDMNAVDHLQMFICERMAHLKRHFENENEKWIPDRVLPVSNLENNKQQNGVAFTSAKVATTDSEPKLLHADSEMLFEKMYTQKSEETKNLKKKIANLQKDNCDVQKELVKWKILCEETEVKVGQLQLELTNSQQIREELSNTLGELRKKYKDNYASTFQQEVDLIKSELQHENRILREELQQASEDKQHFHKWRTRSIKQISELRNSLRQTQWERTKLEEHLEEQKRDHSHLSLLHKDIVDQLEQLLLENRRLRLKIEVLKREVENTQSNVPVRVTQSEIESSDRNKPQVTQKESEGFWKELASMSSELRVMRNEHTKLQKRHLELIADMNTILENRKAMEKIKEQVTTLERQLIAGNVRNVTVPEWVSITKS